jgi:hypothetical protein
MYISVGPHQYSQILVELNGDVSADDEEVSTRKVSMSKGHIQGTMMRRDNNKCGIDRSIY